MRKIGFVIGRIVLVVMALAIGGGFMFFINTGKDGAEVSDEGAFSEIIFPEYVAAIDANLPVEDNIKADNLKNENILNSYFTVKEKISDGRKSIILKAFSMTDDNMVSKDSCLDILMKVYRKGNEELDIYENGIFEYRKDTSDKTDETVDKDLKIDNHECFRRAEDFLKTKHLLPEGFEPGNIADTIEEYANSNEQNVVSKDVIFYRKLNGIDVEGCSKIIVSLNSKGSINHVYSSYREMDKEVKVHNKVSIEEAVRKMIDRQGQVYINEESDKITLDDIEVVYYEDASEVSDNITIQPIYRIKGKCLKDNKEIDKYIGLTHAMKN